MKSLMTLLMAGVMVAGAGFANIAEAGDDRRNADRRRAERRDHRRDRYDDRRDRRDDRRVGVRYDRYLGARDVVIIRDYYRPHYRPLPRGMRQFYARRGYLPRGWAKRIHPVPVYVERRLPPVPRGYRRGIIDGHVVVHNASGFVLDVALLF